MVEQHEQGSIFFQYQKLAMNISNLYMAFDCQEKTSPIDRKEERDIIRPKVNEALTNDPMVPACVFHRECQYAKRVCTKHL